MESIAQRMNERNYLLANKCKIFGLSEHRDDQLHKPNSWEFLVNRKFHIIWCNVFKAASTSWMYNFNILAGYSPQFLRKSNIVPLELARKRYGRVSMNQVNTNKQIYSIHNQSRFKLIAFFSSVFFFLCFSFRLLF